MPSLQVFKRSSLSCKIRTKEHQSIEVTLWFLWFRIRGHFQQIQLEKEEGPGLPPLHQLWGLLPQWSQYVGTGRWADADMPASAPTPVVGPQATPPMEHPPMSRIAPLWGKGDPPILVTGVLPRLLGKTRAGGNTWQHTCSLKSPEFKDTLLIARAKMGTEHTPEEHTIISHALKHKKVQACTSRPAPFMIPPGIMKELTSMMQTWLMNEALCPPAVRQEPDNTLNLLDVDFWLCTEK